MTLCNIHRSDAFWRAFKADHEVIRRKAIAFIGIALLFGCGRPVKTGLARSREEQPSASVKVSDLQPIRKVSSIGPLAKARLVFLDNERLLFAAMFSSVPGNIYDDQLQSNLAVVVLSGATGQLEGSRQWMGVNGRGILGDRLVVLADRSGGAVLGVGDNLLHLSSNLKSTATRLLTSNPVERNGYMYYDSWGLRIGTQGGPALLTQQHPFGGTTNHWISLATLRDQASEPGPNYATVILVGTSVVFKENKYDPHNPYAQTPILVQERGLKPHPLCGNCSDSVAGTFGSQLMFVETQPSGSYMVTDLNGNIVFRGNHSHGTDRISGTAGAAKANRIAFVYGPSTFVPSHSMKLRLAVLDADLKKEVWDQSVEIRPEREGSSGIQMTGPLLALSPDGHKLAVLANGLLQTFSIP